MPWRNTSSYGRQQEPSATHEKKPTAGFSLQFVALTVVVSCFFGASVAIIGSSVMYKPYDIASRTMDKAPQIIANEGLNNPATNSPADGDNGSDQAGVLQASFVATDNISIAEKIGAVLQAAKFEGYSIDIVFAEGKATIDGRVTSEEERQKISALCLSVPGVQSVDNKLVCDPDAGRIPM